MIERQSIEGFIKYALELIQRIKSRQKIESRYLKTYKSGRTSGWDIVLSSAEGERKSAFYRVSFIPTHGGTPYTEFDIISDGYPDAGYFMYDDTQQFTNKVTQIVYVSANYGATVVSLRINARSVDTGTIEVVQL